MSYHSCKLATLQRMKLLLRFLFTLCLILWIGQSTYAQKILLSDDSSEIDVKGNLEYFHDPLDSFTVENIQEAKFVTTSPDRVPTLGFDRASHWFRLRILNYSRSNEWYLEVSNPPLDLIEFYSVNDSTNRWTKKESGDKFPISDREVRHRNPMFSFQMRNQEEKTFYIRVKSNSSVQVPITLWESKQFYKASGELQFRNGLFYGALLIMIFYNVFLYISIRDKITLFYIFTLLSGVNVISFFQGYGFFYLYPQHPEWNNLFAILSGPLFIITSSLLTRSFLDLRNFSPFLDRLLIADALLAVTFSLSMVIFFPRIPFYYLHYLTIFHCLLILICAAYCFSKSFRPARYFLLAWITLLMAAVALSLKNLGWIYANYISSLSLYLGGIMQTLLISFAIGDRLNILTKENREAKEKEFKNERETNLKLEKEVLLRTEDLSLKNSELQELNIVKDKLFSIISHDLKGPLNSLKGSLTVLKMGGVNEIEFKKLIDGIGIQLHHTSDFLSNLLQWAKMQMDGHFYSPEEIKLSSIAESNFQLLKSEFIQKGIISSSTLKNDMKAWADPNMVDAVFRNIISNAIKYSKQGGSVIVSAIPKKEMIEVSIVDTGIGIPAHHLAELFTLQGVTTQGTREEKGTGIGLVLCKELIEKNGGKIWATSKEGEGSSISFTLPLRKG